MEQDRQPGIRLVVAAHSGNTWETMMVAILILTGLLIGLILFDMAALRWGIDSSADDARSEWQGLWRGVHDN